MPQRVFTAVEGDPFAPKTNARPAQPRKLTPVSGDPFAPAPSLIKRIMTADIGAALGLTRSTDERIADYRTNDGTFDRLGDLMDRGTEGVRAGISRLSAAIAPRESARVDAQTRAANLERAANSPVAGEQTFDGLAAKPSIGSLAQFMLDQGAQSIPGMAMAALGPGGAAIYGGSLTGQIGQQRARNDGRTNATLGDVGSALPFAAGSAVLERAGVGGIIGASGRNAAVRIGKAAVTEAATEAGQSSIEYTGGALGTDSGFNVRDMRDQAIAGAIGGAGMGGGFRGVGEGVAAARGAPAPAPANDTTAALPAPPQFTPVVGDPFAAPSPRVASPPAPLPVVDPQPIVAKPAAAGDGELGPEPAMPAAQPVEPPPAAPVAPVLRAPEEDAGPLADGESYVTTPSNQRIRTRFEVVPAASLVAAEGAMQNRDRTQATTDLQVQNIISNFDPQRLGDSAETDRGAMIVGNDNVVESGNGRVLALNRIFAEHPEKAQAYRDFIQARGLSVDGVENPVLIRRRMNDMTPEQVRAYVVASNKDTKLELSATERARSDADSMTPDLLARYAGGDLNSTANMGFVEGFNKSLTTGELGNMIGGDMRLTTTGKRRIENAVVARAYGNPKLLARMMESDSDDIRAITGSMADVAVPWAKLRQATETGDVPTQYDITAHLADAAARVSDARKKDMKARDLLAQRDAFDPIDPIAMELIRGFYNAELTRASSRPAVTKFLQDYVAAAQAQEATEGLFGTEPPKAPLDMIRDLLERRDNPDGAGLLDRAGPIAAPREAEPVTELSTALAERKARRLARTEKANGPERTDGRNESRNTQGAVREDEGRADQGGDRSEEVRPDDNGLNETPVYSANRSPVYAEARPYDPEFATLSFTNRTSIFNSAAEALGIDPDKFTLMPAPRQVQLLRDAMALKFGVTVQVDRGMQERFAIDQMLDAYQNVQGMAHVLDLPAAAISLGGALKLKLVNKGRFLGMYQPGETAITLPRRSNSFAHEWGHALDFHLLSLIEETGKGLSGAIRKLGVEATDAIGAPPTVRDAFVDLLNSMFFTQAGVSAKIMEHEAKILQTDSATVKAAAQLAIDKLKGGNSQVRGIRSAFYTNAKKFDGAGGDYWQSPTEMMARSFEAYVSYKVEAAGLTTEFIGKGDAGYLSNADKRFAETFPKDDERAAIFAAFEQLFGKIADEQVLGQGIGAAKPAGSVRRMTDYDKTPKVARERNVIKREVAAMKRAVMQAKKEAANRPDDAKGMMEKIADLNGVTFMTMTGNLRMIQGRSGSRALQKLIDLLTKQDGRGDRTVARTFAEDVHLQSKAAVNRLGNILKANGVDSRNAEQDMELRDLLTGAREDAVTPGMMKAAAAIRHLLDNEFYVNQQAGIDLGYTRNGYLARVLDLPKVYGDQPGFVREATKVYELVFDQEFGTDPDELMTASKTTPTTGGKFKVTESFPVFMKMAMRMAKGGANLPSLADVRALLKQIKALEGDKAKSDEPDAIQAKLDKLQVELSEAVGDLMDEVRPVYTSERAEAWLAKINLVAGAEHNAGSPDSKYTKQRELPPEADKIMEKYFLSDPVESVTNYLVTSARRTAYARRFGADGAKRLALFEQMAAEGVSPDDQRTVERVLNIATGRMRSELAPAFQQTAAFVNAMGTMALLPRAVISSLAEPFTTALITGDARDGFRTMGMAIGGALGSPSGKVRFELARAMGIISDAASDDIMEARYGQTFADATRWDRYTATMFRRTGLTGLTRAQKTAGVGMGHAFLDSLSHKVAEGAGTSRDQAIALLRELGVRDPEAFAKEIVTTGRLPTPEEIDSDFGHDYATAQLRFSDMVVQSPGAMDRPELSQNPVGRVVYGITGFSYGYWRNITKRNGILLAEMGKRQGLARAALYGGQLFAGAAVAYLIGTTISTIREYLLNPKRWADLEKKGELESTMAQLGFTRTFSFGAADTVIQTWSGLKYQRDLSNVFVGPGLGFMLQNAQKMSQPVRSNSRTTNSAEYNATQGAYSAASPFIAFGLARIPGGPAVDVATGVGMAYATSANARDLVATTVVGAKHGSPGPDGKKIKSGPTAYDRALDGVFGKVERKKRDASASAGAP